MPPDHFDARVELGHEVESHTALLFPLRRLVGDLCTFLSIRDGGVQRFVLRLEHEVVKCAGLGGTGAAATRREDSVAYTEVEVGLLAAEREPAMLFELARSRLERVSIPAPVVRRGLPHGMFRRAERSVGDTPSSSSIMPAALSTRTS